MAKNLRDFLVTEGFLCIALNNATLGRTALGSASNLKSQECDGRKGLLTSRIVDLGWANEDITIYPSESVSDHLGS